MANKKVVQLLKTGRNRILRYGLNTDGKYLDENDKRKCCLYGGVRFNLKGQRYKDKGVSNAAAEFLRLAFMHLRSHLGVPHTRGTQWNDDCGNVSDAIAIYDEAIELAQRAGNESCTHMTLVKGG